MMTNLSVDVRCLCPLAPLPNPACPEHGECECRHVFHYEDGHCSELGGGFCECKKFTPRVRDLCATGRHATHKGWCLAVRDSSAYPEQLFGTALQTVMDLRTSYVAERKHRRLLEDQLLERQVTCLEAEIKSAQLEADVERLRRERDAYKKAKQENDDRFMGERDAALIEIERLKHEKILHGLYTGT